MAPEKKRKEDQKTLSVEDVQSQIADPIDIGVKKQKIDEETLSTEDVKSESLIQPAVRLPFLSSGIAVLNTGGNPLNSSYAVISSSDDESEEEKSDEESESEQDEEDKGDKKDEEGSEDEDLEDEESEEEEELPSESSSSEEDEEESEQESEQSSSGDEEDKEEKSPSEEEPKQEEEESSPSPSSSDEDKKVEKSKPEKVPRRKKYPNLSDKVKSLLRKHYPDRLAAISNQDDDDDADYESNENKKAAEKKEKKTRKGYKMVTFDVEGEPFTITLDKIKEAFPETSLIRLMLQSREKFKEEKALRKNAIKVGEGQRIKKFYFYLALEWARLPKEHRFADVFIKAALANQAYIPDLEIDENKDPEFIMEVDGNSNTIKFLTRFIMLLMEFATVMDYFGLPELAEQANLILLYFADENFVMDPKMSTIEIYMDPHGTLQMTPASVYRETYYLISKSTIKITKNALPAIWYEEYSEFLTERYPDSNVGSERVFEHDGSAYITGLLSSYVNNERCIKATIAVTPLITWIQEIPSNLARLFDDTFNKFVCHDDHEQVLSRLKTIGLKLPKFWSAVKKKLLPPDEVVRAAETLMTRYDVEEDNVNMMLWIIRDTWPDLGSQKIKDSVSAELAEIMARGMEQKALLQCLSLALYMDCAGILGLFNWIGRIDVLEMLTRAITYLVCNQGPDVPTTSSSSPLPLCDNTKLRAFFEAKIILMQTLRVVNKWINPPNEDVLRACENADLVMASDAYYIPSTVTSCRLGITIPRNRNLGIFELLEPTTWMVAWSGMAKLVNKRVNLQRELKEVTDCMEIALRYNSKYYS